MKMRTRFTILLTALMVVFLSACGDENKPAETSSADDSTSVTISEDSTGIPSSTESDEEQSGETSTALSEESESEQEPEGAKILVAYFSATGNTEAVAQKLADGLGADLYEIEPEQPYTEDDLDYGNSKSRSSVEMNDPDARPAISSADPNLQQYDTVLLGYPIWWGEAPRIMSTFVESYDSYLDGKTVACFCTSGSSGFGSSDSALREAVPAANWLEGHRFSAGASAEDVLEWADGLGIRQGERE